MTITNLSASQLRRAADLKEKIEQLQSELDALQNGGSGSVIVKSSGRKFSAAGLERIRAAQKARWAKVHAGQPAKAAKPAKTGKRKMSAAGRAAIIAAQKARWAKVKAGKK